MNNTLTLNPSFLRDLGVIAEDEGLLTKAIRYIHKLATKKEDSTLITKEEFFARVDASRAQYERGEYHTIRTPEELNKFLNSFG